MRTTYLIPVLLVLQATPMTARGEEESPFADAPVVLSRERLDGLEFSSTVDDARAALDVEGLAAGVWMSQGEYQQGEPIWAYFVVKNHHEEVRGVDMMLDFSGSTPLLVNSCDIHLRDVTRDAEVNIGGKKIWICGSEPRLVIPDDGYYIVRGDMAKFADLPAGEYELSWTYAGGLQSNVARFTLQANDAIERTEAKPEHSLFLLLNEHGEGIQELQEMPHDSPDFEIQTIQPQPTRWMLATLATGVGDKWYPDVQHLPSSDGEVTVEAAFHFAQGDEQYDRITVTVTATDEGKRFVERPHVLMLQLVSESQPQVQLTQPHQQALKLARRLDLPATFTVEVPRSWRSEVDMAGEVKIALVLASEPIRLPQQMKMMAVKMTPKAWPHLSPHLFVGSRARL